MLLCVPNSSLWFSSPIGIPTKKSGARPFLNPYLCLTHAATTFHNCQNGVPRENRGVVIVIARKHVPQG